MANAKFVKTAAAVALGTSVVATAVAPSASAATTYKIKSGKLYQTKSGKTTLVKGYKTYKNVLYKDGKKYTGTRSGKYYKAGVLATGTYKGVKYKKGAKFTGVSTNGKFYKNGVLGTGTYKNVKYKKGVEYTGVSTNGKYYENGVVATGVKTVDGVVYVDGVKDTVAPVITVAEDQTVAYGSDFVLPEVKVEDNSAEEIKAVATITFEGKEVEAIDTKIAGEYTVTYTAKDVNGNEAEVKTIKVTVEKAGFAAKEVTLVTTTAVTVSFDALTEDQEGVELEVTNGKGEAVAVKPVNLSKGDKEAQFVFVTPQTEETQTGVWNFGSVSYDFDAIKNFDAIVTAAQAGTFNEVTFYNALVKADIKNVSDAKLVAYKDAVVAAVAAAQANSTTEQKAEKLADIQTIIDAVNKSVVDAEADKEIVKAVAAAENNVQLLKALQDNFVRVNADWITDYSTATVATDASTTVSLLNLTKDNFGSATSEAIQTAIDTLNATKVSAKWDTAWATPTADNVKAAKDLVKYIANDTEAEKADKAYYEDELARLEAVVNVFTVATSTATNSSLEKAIQNLDQVEDALVAKYKDTAKAANFTNELDAKTVNTDLLTKYRTALKAVTDAGKQNQAKDIQEVITTVNNAENQSAIDTAIAKLNAAAKVENATDADVLAALKAVQNVNAAPVKNEIKDSSAAAYKAAVVAKVVTNTTDFADLDAVNTLIGEVNAEEANKVALSNLNAAKTAEEVQTVLISLVDAESSVVANFSAVATADQKYVAAAVLENRPETTGYASLTDVKSAIDAAATTVTNTLDAVNSLISTSTKADVIAALTLKDAQFEALTVSQKQVKAETFVNGLVFENGALKTPFKSVSAIYAQLLK